MKKVEVRIVRDDQKEFVLDNAVWGIPSDGLEGFDSVDNEIFTENMASGDGSRYTGERVSEKERTVKARLLNASLNETMRYYAISFFNPKHSFKVYITYQGRTRWCEGRQIAFSCPTGNVYKPIEIKWSILSTMPYMMSVEDFGKDIASSLPLFSFPFWSIVGYGFGTGTYRFAKEVEIDNEGDVETFFRCVITATGDVTNPKLLKDNKYVRIKDVLHEGDVYEIDFVKKPPTVKKNGVNAIGNIDRTSSLTKMMMDVGTSKFGFDADNGSNSMSVTLYYNQRYLGV